MGEWASERTFNQSAANRWNEPIAVVPNLRCARSQHEKCVSGLRPVPRRMEKPVIHASRSVHENVNARVAIKAWKSIELATTCMI